MMSGKWVSLGLEYSYAMLQTKQCQISASISLVHLPHTDTYTSSPVHGLPTQHVCIFINSVGSTKQICRRFTHFSEPSSPDKIIKLSHGVLSRQPLKIFEQVLVFKLKQMLISCVLKRLFPE